MKPANFAPVYACLYPELAQIARSHGYALAVHGTMGRDFDLVCIPWSLVVSSPQQVVNDFITKYALTQIGQPKYKNHGRLVYTLSVKFGECFIDLSFTPKIDNRSE